MRRFGIAARIALIVMVALVAVQLLMVAAYVAERRQALSSAPFTPLLEQIAALAQLMDRIGPKERALALAASANPGFVPRIVAAPPQWETPGVLRYAAQRLAALADLAPERVALALITNERRGGEPVQRLRELVGARLLAVVALSGGGYLEVTAGGDLTVRLMGLPIGLLSGILGFLVAIAALVAVRRETRPLSDLADAVGRFGPALEPQTVRERGAPDVRAVIRAVNAMQARIADLVRTRTLVLGAISHDLRTYLTRLRLRLELLPEGPQVDKARADLDGMQALVEDALAFARASFSPVSDAPVDLARIAEAECDARRAQGARVTLAGADAPLEVRGSPVALARVAANLIGNAIAYAGAAEVSLAAEAGCAVLAVEDRGPGIPAAEREAVFEPFHRIEPSRNRESGGAGLGLTIVRQIVEGHGGTVAVEARAGGGARLVVRLPCAASAPPA
ncbi:ATP-binding protein [Xanthobacter sp. KR7-225]|uniref:sensor histidine kinase n=1 Tax=Xanthobacter sp. KR7-225 TaxID=3156613 RepID=UPI0032B43191